MGKQFHVIYKMNGAMYVYRIEQILQSPYQIADTFHTPKTMKSKFEFPFSNYNSLKNNKRPVNFLRTVICVCQRMIVKIKIQARHKVACPYVECELGIKAEMTIVIG